MKFSIRIASKKTYALKLSGAKVLIRGIEFLSVRSAVLQYSEKSRRFECETHDFANDEKVYLYINGEKMCDIKNGEAVVVNVLRNRHVTRKSRRKIVCFLEKKTQKT